MDDRPIRTFTIRFLTVFIALIAINATATQWVAGQLQFDDALGEPVYAWLYQPFAWIGWAIRFSDIRPEVFDPLMMLLAGASLIVTLAFFVVLQSRNDRPDGKTHGTARWATRDDLISANVLGVPDNDYFLHLGSWRPSGRRSKPQYLRSAGTDHMALIAPTRAGKGVSVIVPTLLSWRGSSIVYDQKGELFQLTSGWRNENVGPCYRFDPTSDENFFRFNPLDCVRFEERAGVADAQNLALLILDEGKGLHDHWLKSAHGLLTGLILFICFECKRDNVIATLATIGTSLSDPKRTQDELFSMMAINSFGDNREPHQAISESGAAIAATPDKERGSIISTLTKSLTIYRDPILTEATRSSTIPVTDLMNGDRPVTVYVTTPEEHKGRLVPFVRLYYTMVLKVLLRKRLTKAGASPNKWPLLFLLDEFISLGKMEMWTEALTYIAGYGMRCMLVIQDIELLEQVYGRSGQILSNCRLQVSFSPSNIKTAEWLSKSLGRSTEVKLDVTHSGDRIGSKSSSSERWSEVGRELLYPDEVRRLPGLKKNAKGETVPGKLIILIGNEAPILANQTPFFLDKTMSSRSTIDPAETVHSVGAPADIMQPGESHE